MVSSLPSLPSSALLLPPLLLCVCFHCSNLRIALGIGSHSVEIPVVLKVLQWFSEFQPIGRRYSAKYDPFLAEELGMPVQSPYLSSLLTSIFFLFFFFIFHIHTSFSLWGTYARVRQQATYVFCGWTATRTVGKNGVRMWIEDI